MFGSGDKKALSRRFPGGFVGDSVCRGRTSADFFAEDMRALSSIDAVIPEKPAPDDKSNPATDESNREKRTGCAVGRCRKESWSCGEC